jgi:hypothetical protein
MISRPGVGDSCLRIPRRKLGALKMLRWILGIIAVLFVVWFALAIARAVAGLLHLALVVAIIIVAISIVRSIQTHRHDATE